MMTPRDHQVDISTRALNVISQHGCVYLAMEERTGKTLTAILVSEQLWFAKTILVVTLKRAIEGWTNTFERYPTSNEYDIVNYEKLKHVTKSYDLVIIDEAHSKLGSIPKFTNSHQQLHRIIGKHAMVMYLSATPHAQGYHMLFNQFNLCSYHKWSTYKSYIAWLTDYGTGMSIGLRRSKGVYNFKEYNEYLRSVDTAKIKADTDHLIITKSRIDIGFQSEPKDLIHYVPMSPPQKVLYNKMASQGATVIIDDIVFEGETHASKNIMLNMLEGGTISQKRMTKASIIELEAHTEGTPPTPRYETQAKILDNDCQSKIGYIQSVFGDTKDMAIMFHFVQEEELLKRYFRHARILSGNKYAMGITIREPILIIYSQGFSTAQYIQRRARQTDYTKEGDITVHYILTKGAPSDKIYQTVAINKVNYTNSLFEFGRLRT